MLRQEEAEKRLKAFKVSDGEKRRLARVAGLAEPLRGMGYAVLGHNPGGKRMDWEEMGRRQTEASAALARLRISERRPLLEALYPCLADAVETALELQTLLAYSTESEEPSFRAPAAPELHAEVRGEWLSQLADVTAQYEQSPAWYAAWAPYLNDWSDCLGLLLAGAIEVGGPEGDAVLDTLVASSRGEHEIGAMGTHVVLGLFIASRPEGWEALERLLLAAQRQEGVRQSILESAHEGQPEAFRRILRLILDHDLLRFSATIRAVDVWFGHAWEAEQTRAAEQAVRLALSLMEDPDVRARALSSGDPPTVAMALWAAAFEDAVAAVAPAECVLQDESPELRFVAARALAGMGHPAALRALVPAVEDADLRVAATALAGVSGAAESLADTDLFERLERSAGRFPRAATTLEPLVWPWASVQAEADDAYDALVECLGDRPPKRLLAHVQAMSGYRIARVVEILTAKGKRQPDEDLRAALLGLVGSNSQDTRRTVFEALGKIALRAEEAPALEALLTRKAADLRRGVIQLLLRQADRGTLASAERLLAAKDAQQRAAGAELLQQMHAAGRDAEGCRHRAEAYRERVGKLSPAEEGLLGKVLAGSPKQAAPAEPTLDDGLGLIDHTLRTPAVQPVPVPGLQYTSPAAEACVKSLVALFKQHRDDTVTVEGWDGSKEESPLGDAGWQFPEPKPEAAPEQDLVRLPLADVWEGWWQARLAAERDADGLELLRALVATIAAYGVSKENASVYDSIMLWLTRAHDQPGSADFLLDALQDALAREAANRADGAGGKGPGSDTVFGIARQHRQLCPSAWDAARAARLWRLLRWWEQPIVPEGKRRPKRKRPELDDLVAAFRAGAATDADVFEHLVGPRIAESEWSVEDFDGLETLTSRSAEKTFADCPALRDVVQRCKDRILDIELARGELPTAATLPAMSLKHVGGARELLRILRAMGALSFDRGGYYFSEENKPGRGLAFSRLVRGTRPGPDDTPEAFVAAAREAGIPPRRLVELAVYAPQWARHAEAAAGWPELAEGAWWLHAHTKDQGWEADEEVREEWAGAVAERTPLTSDDLLEGAVDVQWFLRTHGTLGDERWNALDAAAKYASSGSGHKRAQLFADAMRGRLTREDLLARIDKSRHQDAVRALGLVPLAQGTEREGDLLARYEALQEFVRTSRQFGSQRQASEKLAATIGQQNLARTAGYADPMRLQWAMELRAVADLAEGPLCAMAGDTTVALSISPLGEPQIAVQKAGKPLKDVPAALKKEPAIAALRERKTDIQRQASRMRRSLEEAMCRGDAFTGEELRRLWGHPVLAPMLRSLVFASEQREQGEEGDKGEGLGYPVDGAAFLQSHDGTLARVTADQPLRVAHPHDLLASGNWAAWQRECFLHERVQPFKQVFRELYPITAQEKEQEDGQASHRYAGHQVNPRQAMALLGGRGWVARPEEGVFRTFHEAGLTAALEFNEYFTTPAEVEGLTVEAVHFLQRGGWEPVPLADVPARLFSEVMRDVDLVVSVAHQGGVDPEASASTMEMRASLIRETCGLLKVANVRTEGHHAIVEGELGHYAVHLGSAGVHKLPGGYVCIVPVHSQHRGRLFLPFVDEDPRTAEVLAKVLLLAKDKEIKDPIILQQILR